MIFYRSVFLFLASLEIGFRLPGLAANLKAFPESREVCLEALVLLCALHRGVFYIHLNIVLKSMQNR